MNFFEKNSSIKKLKFKMILMAIFKVFLSNIHFLRMINDNKSQFKDYDLKSLAQQFEILKKVIPICK